MALPGVPAARRYEAFLLEWDPAPEARAGADRIGALVEDLCARGAEVAVVSRGGVEGVDGALRARPAGPGSLHLLAARGSEAFRVDGAGPRLAWRGERPGDPDATRWFLGHLWSRGIGPGLVLVARVGISAAAGPEEPAAFVPMEGDASALERLLRDQLRRRVEGEVPAMGSSEDWSLTIDGLDAARERVHETLLTLADGRYGTSGVPLLPHPASEPRVLVAGAYTAEGRDSDLLRAPVWNQVPGSMPSRTSLRRRLDLRSGVLLQELRIRGRQVRALQFSSLDAPGTMVMRVTGLPGDGPPVPRLLPPGQGVEVEAGICDGLDWLRVASGASEAAAVVRDEHDPRRGRLDRVTAYVRSGAGIGDAANALNGMDANSFDALLSRHRAAWAARWETADVEIEGDPALTRAVRFALFHLMGSAADEGEAAVGARGMSGAAYRGHVFWDSDVFVLPFLAATHPASARAMLEYRVRRLPAARAAAREAGREGARFPWESAATGRDVTPLRAPDPTGRTMLIRTGLLEDHITADVAWAARCYADWSGDAEFERGPGAELMVETARYWASRIRVDRQGRGHVYGVTGPDEYHEAVDDDAYTNVMARWNLRQGARCAAAGHAGARADEARRWTELAGALVDGYDPATGIYEQFAGFRRLEPVLVRDAAPRRPIAGDVLLGRERTAGAQVIKQAAVLMLHHLVPEETAPGSLRPNLDYYEPRTAHGSSLSPAIHAGLFARAGRFDEALRWLHLASRIDLDDVTRSTARGLHVATMGGVWQALVMGFAGIRPLAGGLRIAPRIPRAWPCLRVRLSFRGAPLRIETSRSEVRVEASRPLDVVLGDGSRHRVPAGVSTLAVRDSPFGER